MNTLPSLAVNLLLLMAHGNISIQSKEHPMAGNDTKRAKVTIVMVDGSVHKGELIVGTSGRLESVLLVDAPFLEFHPYEGMPRFIAKAHIVTVEAEKFVREQQAA
jgi:hypothetical protein